MKLKTVMATAFALTILSGNVYADNTRDYATLYENWPVENKQMVYDACVEADVDQSYILAIIWNESRFKADAQHLNTNGTIDRGLMQINDACVPFLIKKELITSADDLFDAETNIKCGVELFKYHLDAVDTHDQALCRYQVGEGAYANGRVNDAYYRVKDVQNKYAEIINENSVITLTKPFTLRSFIEVQSLTNETNSITYLSNSEDGEWLSMDDLSGLNLSKRVYIKNESPAFWGKM